MKFVRRLSLLYKFPTIVVVLGTITTLAVSYVVFNRAPDGPGGARGFAGSVALPLAVAVPFLCLSGLAIARLITGPILRLGDAVVRVSTHDFASQIPGTTRGDEIGTIAAAVASLRDDLQQREIVISDQAAIVNAIKSAQAVIEFTPHGRILAANRVLLDTMGYTEAEVVGREHSMFVDDDFVASSEYRRMWDSLSRGAAIVGTFPRVANGGRRVYVQGAYSPVLDASGAVVRVIKVCSDVTASETERRKLEAEAVDHAALIEALSGGLQGMIEFDPNGRVLRANQTFLDTMGYSASEAVGRPHATFVEPAYAESAEYLRMWPLLRQGVPLRGTFKRIAKGGRVVFIEGVYSPVRNRDGQVVRVVKVVSDVTAAETERLEGIERRAAMEAEQNRVVTELSHALAALADGDLTGRIATPFVGEYEALRVNYNDAIGRLEDTLSWVVTVAENIGKESVEFTRSADDLSQRTENQASALEETAASLEELTASVKAAAMNAERANVDVDAARRNAEASGRVVRDAIGAMSEIEKSAEHIAQIIGVIDDIAFQTNLLALNAGVEAARAGEAGRGFAVVASEVRALAQRSSEAAKEIKSLISTSSQHVGRGVELVRETGRSLETIVDAVTGITGLVAEIANASREQSVGLSEINSAVGQLDQVTQQNAAMVEESSAASRGLRGEAEALSRLVSQFQARRTPSPEAAAIGAAAMGAAAMGATGPGAAGSGASRRAAPLRLAASRSAPRARGGAAPMTAAMTAALSADEDWFDL